MRTLTQTAGSATAVMGFVVLAACQGGSAGLAGPSEIANPGFGRRGEFEDRVTAVNTTEQTFTLRNGLTIRMTAETVINSEGDLLSLGAAAAAVAAGRPVRAEGHLDPTSGTFVARHVKFQVDD